MNIEIHLQPESVWDFFKANKGRLNNEMVEIAENSDSNIEIYLTEFKGMPSIRVYRGEERVYEEGGVSRDDTEKTAQSIYAKFLPSQEEKTYGYAYDPEDPQDILEFSEMIDERETVIGEAFQDFLTILLEDDVAAADVFSDPDNVDEMVDYVVRYLAVKCGLHIRRPMMLVDEKTGLDIFTEFPYDEYDFDDKEIQH